MKDQFPFPGKPAVITKEMCDFNGHLQDVHYYPIFEDNNRDFYKAIGFGRDYFLEGFSSFTLETNVRFLSELKEGEKCFPYYRIINVSPKLIHYGGILLTEKDKVSSTCEILLIHIDMSTRKSSVMPEKMLNNLVSMKDEHAKTGDVGFELRLKIK
jgi:acyl-CoA thioesterase FadM|tara:strand:+ start:97 stop:564 length:468 start_codon:yes stop_codon:yes gene_type:complete